MLDLLDKTVLVTGGSGFLGQYVVQRLKKLGVKKTIIPRSASCDLRLWDNCQKAVTQVDVVIHLAGVVGGIGFNRQRPGAIFYDNIMMGTQIMEAARLAGVKKFVGVGTICSYPKVTSIPFKEDNLWNGYPEETNAPYGLAKKMVLVQSQAYREQYDFNSIFLLPVNLYGPRDKFDPNVSHVIPALIRKVFEAKMNGYPEIAVWGTGNATREFLYVEDAADAIILATQNYEKPEPVNIGSGFEISIQKLTQLICKLADYRGKIVWDTTMPDGQPRRRLDVRRAEKEFGFKAQTTFREGLKRTIEWYKSEAKTMDKVEFI